MTGFLIERLNPVGWRRDNLIYWLLADATAEAERMIATAEARAVRILALRVNPDAIYELGSNQICEVPHE
jgi:hypothetical protein